MMLAAPGLPARTVINEIMYHPVEKTAFDAAGDPVMDLSDDVHEFIELKNDGPEPVVLAGWRLAGGADFVFPTGTTVPAGGYVVVAKHPDRLEAIAPYALPAGTVLGPWDGGLGNRGDTVRLEKPDGSVEDAVSYDSALPWPIGANALGAESDWTGIDESQHQYRGRSLERAAAAWASNDPANWLASPLAAGPSPGRANAVTVTAPLPVVTAIDITRDLLPASDAILCRMVLNHLDVDRVSMALDLFRQTSIYLIATQFNGEDLPQRSPQFTRLDLRERLGNPVESVQDGSEAVCSLALWAL